MKKLFIAGALLALAPAVASAADLSGAWKIDGAFDAMGIKYSITCQLKDDGGKLSGPCKSDQGDVQATGTEGDGKAVISYDTTYNGGPVHLDYKGDVQSDGTIKGVIDAGGAQGTFSAAKQ